MEPTKRQKEILFALYQEWLDEIPKMESSLTREFGFSVDDYWTEIEPEVSKAFEEANKLWNK